MASRNELIERGNKLAAKYNEAELKAALKNALIMEDSEERLALQWALKKVTGTSDGYRFTKTILSETKKSLVV